jgi:hypothetical protein
VNALLSRLAFRLAYTSTSPLSIRSSFPLRTSAIEPSTLRTSVEFKALRRRKQSFVFNSLSTINRVRALSFLVFLPRVFNQLFRCRWAHQVQFHNWCIFKAFSHLLSEVDHSLYVVTIPSSCISISVPDTSTGCYPVTFTSKLAIISIYNLSTSATSTRTTQYPTKSDHVVQRRVAPSYGYACYCRTRHPRSSCNLCNPSIGRYPRQPKYGS